MFISFVVMNDNDDKQFMLELYQQYYPLMKKRSLIMISDYQVVDDLIQDACIKLIPKIPLLRSLDCCKRTSYIVYTIKNVCFDYLRNKSRNNQKLQIICSDIDVDNLVVSQETPEDCCIRKERYEELGQALGLLSKRDRELLMCKYLLGMRERDIAECLDIPVRNIQGYLSRARRRARSVLTKTTE